MSTQTHSLLVLEPQSEGHPSTSAAEMPDPAAGTPARPNSLVVVVNGTARKTKGGRVLNT